MKTIKESTLRRLIRKELMRQLNEDVDVNDKNNQDIKSLKLDFDSLIHSTFNDVRDTLYTDMIKLVEKHFPNEDAKELMYDILRVMKEEEYGSGKLSTTIYKLIAVR